MSAPTLDRNPRTSTQTGPSTGPRRRRTPLVLAASALAVLAIAVGTSLAIATRPDAPQATADAGVAPVAVANDQSDQNANADQNTTAQPGQDTQTGTATKPDTSTKSDSKASSSGSGAAAPAALADGTHDAYITRIDRASNRIVVDVVQVFDGQAARDAAIADGMARDNAQYLGVYVRNQNPRLRTLPLARDLRLDLRGGDCEAPLNHQLTKLATDAQAMSGPIHTYYFTLTVSHGKVQQIQERLAINAC